MCEAFIRNAIEMGEVAPGRKDSTWFAGTNRKVHRLVMNSLRYPTLTPEERAGWQERTRECVRDYARSLGMRSGAVRLVGYSLFMMPMVLDAFPSAHVMHLIRDGRDAMLSRLNARMDFRSPLDRLVVFGDADVAAWRVAAYRNELEMQHWVTAVTFGLRGRAYGDRYLEVRYEDVCADPIMQFERIFHFLDLPFRSGTRTWLTKCVYRTRVGKWRHLPREKIDDALAIGADLLRQLGYV